MDTKNIHEDTRETPSEEELKITARCGNCHSYRKIRRGLGCRKRGGLRSPVAGVDCEFFKVREE